MTLHILSSLTPDILTALSEIHSHALTYQCWNETAIAGIIAQPHHHIRVAVKDDIAAGFIVWRCILDESELLTIAVNPVFLREKIGSALLNEMISDASMVPVKQCFLEVAEDNIAAQHFYSTFDFTVFSSRKNYYPRGENPPVNAILMRRSFT